MRQRGSLFSSVWCERPHPWVWGGDPDSFKYPEDHLFNRFTDCVKRDLIVEWEEFAAYSVTEEKGKGCVELLKAPMVSRNIPSASSRR